MIFGAIGCFNSQPPEGGWFDALAGLFSQSPFQLTAARRRLVTDMGVMPYQAAFQLTAARRRLARQPSRHPNHGEFQLTAARRRLAAARVTTAPPAAFQLTAARRRLVGVRRVFNFITSFNSQPPEGGWTRRYLPVPLHLRFQLTAARRRLDVTKQSGMLQYVVSTHSRPKAAGRYTTGTPQVHHSFNSQPPEGGWEINKYLFYATPVSTHSRPKAAGCINKYVPC